MKQEFLIQVGKGKNWITVGVSSTIKSAGDLRRAVVNSPLWIAPESTIERLARVRIVQPDGKIA